MSAGTDRRPALRRLAALLAVSAVLLFFDFGARLYTTNDEARFPMMARDIVRNGHWLLPEINGVPMLNKPPLHAWLIAIAAWPSWVGHRRSTAAVTSFAIPASTENSKPI